MAITPQQRIQIKRRNSVPASAEGWAYLLDGELGYVKNENGLYIGLGDGRSAVKVNINSWDELKDKVNATISSDGLMSAADKKKLDNTNVAYGTCSTAASTAQKNIVITSQGDWSLQIGSIIVVKFTNTNTANYPVFKVGNAAEKSVWYNTALISTSNLSYAGYKDRPSMYMYDGTQFVWLGWTVDSNSDTKVTQSAAITTAGEYPVLLGYSTATTSVTNTVNKAAAFTYNPNTKILTAETFKGKLTGNADTATKLKTARTIAISGGATGTAISFDGSGNITIPVTALDPTKLSSAVAINKGGTGATTAAQALINLGLTATAAELNYVDGVSSNIQTQLNGKAPSTHTHNYLPLTGGDLSGQLNISANTFGVLTINRTTASKIPGIGFKHQGTLTGYLGMNTNGEFVRYDAEGSNGKKLLDANNYKDYCTPANIGAAASSHNHSASNITSGTLAVARGGTGITSNPSMLINLGSTTAASVFAASPRPGITGTLPVANGGTGKTTAKDAANALINALETGTSKPADGDYYISQYVNGGTTTTTYHRRSISKLWEYMKDKTDDLYLPLAGGTLTGALTISDGGIDVTGMAKLNNGTNFFGGGYTRLYSSSSQLQLEAWASNTTTSTETMTRAVLALYHSSDLDKSVRFLKYNAGSGSTYYLYGTHNITKGTDPITAKISKLETNCIYLQYD